MRASLLHPLASAFVVDAFIIRRAAFPSMPKTAKPYTDLTSVLVQFVSLCVIFRIYSYFMHLCSIYSGHMQPARVLSAAFCTARTRSIHVT